MTTSESNRPGLNRARRSFNKRLAAVAGAAVAPAIIVRGARAAERIVVAQPGGPYETAFAKAFAEPFTKASGIEVALVARPFFPTAQVQTQVETKSYQWDVVSLSSFDVEILARKNLLENLNLPSKDLEGVMPNAIRPQWLGVDVYATVMGYRTDRIKGEGPRNWADLWNVSGIPGRRAMYKSPIGTLEQALMADGVAPKDIYPIDYARAFRKLDEIKAKVNTWWSSGVQSTQLLRDGGADVMAVWNGRAQAAIDDGAPVRIVWNQGLYTVHGFSIPRGAPKRTPAFEFIRFCASAERQAAYTPHLAGGPTNLKAYNFIDAKLAATLPTAPAHLGTLLEQSTTWWTDNKDDAVNRFNQWLIV